MREQPKTLEQRMDGLIEEYRLNPELRELAILASPESSRQFLRDFFDQLDREHKDTDVPPG